MASDGGGKVKNKKSKDAGKPYSRPQPSFLGNVGSTLKEMIPSWVWPSLKGVFADDSQTVENAIAGVRIGQIDDPSTGSSRILGRSSNSVGGRWQSQGRSLDSFRSSAPAPDPQIQGRALDSFGDGILDPNPRIHGQSSDSSEGRVKATETGYLVECDGFQQTFDYNHAILTEDLNPPSSVVSRPPLSSASIDDPSTVCLSSVAGASTVRGSSSEQFSSNNNGSSTKRSAPLPSGKATSSTDADANARPGQVGAPPKKRCVEINNARTAVVDEPEKSDEEADVEKSEENESCSEKSFVWQTKSNPSSASQRSYVKPGAPAACQNKPGFDLGTFYSTMNNSGQRDASLLNDTQRHSPFYKGKTTYGGASALKPRHYDPGYQVMPTVRPQVTKIRPVANTSAERPLSFTANMILQGLDKAEKMNDANASTFNSSLADSLLTFTPRTYKRNSQQASSPSRKPGQSAGPPVNQQMTPVFAIIKKNVITYQGFPPDNKVSSQTENADRSRAEPLTNTPGSYDLPSAVPCTQAPGKMRREPTRKHYSARAAEREEDTPMNVDLSTIALPLTNFKPFTSDIASGSSTGLFMGRKDRTEPMDTVPFTFGKPITMNANSKSPDDSQQKRFHFRSPIDVDDHRSNGMPASSSQQPPAPSYAVGTSNPSSLAFTFKLDAAVRKDPPPTGGLAAASELKSGSVMDFLSNCPASSSVTSPATASSTLTSPAVQPPASTAAVVDVKKPLSELFKAKTAKWSCPSCYVQNGDDVTKCPCCGECKPTAKATPGPAPTFSAAPASTSDSATNVPMAMSLTDLFKPSADTWKCPTCDVQNGKSHNECPCCQTKRPTSGAKADGQPCTATGASSKTKEEPAKVSETQQNSGIQSLLSLFKKPPGDWVCATCMVQNKEHQLKCGACEEPKPGAKPVPSNGATSPATGPSGGQAETQGFKFSSASGAFGSGAPAGQLVFGAPSSTVTTGVTQAGGFSIPVPSGGFSGFGTSGFGSTGFGTGGFGAGFTAPKQDPAPASGGFKPTGFTGFGSSPRSDANGPSTKSEALSFLPPATGGATAKGEATTAAPMFGGTSFGSTAAKPGGGGFSFLPNNGSEADLKPGAHTFGSFGQVPTTKDPAAQSGFTFGGTVNSEGASASMQRPPLRPSADNTSQNCGVDAGVGSSVVGNHATPVTCSLSPAGLFGSNSAAFDVSKSTVSASSAGFSFGPSVTSSSTLLFGPAKTSADVPAQKFGFSATQSSLPTAFGAPSTSLAAGTTQLVFSAPSSIPSASVAVSAAAGVFAPPAVPAEKLAGMGVPKSNPFNFAEDAIPKMFKFGETQPSNDAAKPTPVNMFQFSQQSQSSGPSSGFQFGASSNTAASGAGAFNSTGAPVFGQPAAASASGVFKFGAGPTNAQSNPAGVFTFGAKPASDAVPKPDVMPSFSQLGGKRSMDDDGAATKKGRSNSDDMPMQDVEATQQTPKPVVGFTYNSPPSGFGFNPVQASTPINNPGFMATKPAPAVQGFGNPSTGAAPTAPSPFGFMGQQPAAPAPVFGSQSGTNVANGGANQGYSFAASSMAPTGFNFASTPNFNFSGQPPNPAGGNLFNAQPAAAVPPGRTIKKAVRRSAVRK